MENLDTLLENDQLNSLHQLQIPDIGENDDYKDIVALAAQNCDTPMAAVVFAGNDHWRI